MADPGEQLQLKREQTRALEMLVAALPYAEIMTVASLPQEELCTGFMAFTAVALANKELPHAQNWYWSQGGGRVEATVGERVHVSMKKLVSRPLATVAREERPIFKCWVFGLRLLGGEEAELEESLPRHFVWCERGADRGPLWERAFLERSLEPEEEG